MDRRIVEVMERDQRKALLERRQAIAEEIARHPRPITACDVHFNRMLEERAALTEEIDRLEALEDRRDPLPAADAHRD
jgi:uncharacterized protein YdcH (DUF465 family)